MMLILDVQWALPWTFFFLFFFFLEKLCVILFTASNDSIDSFHLYICHQSKCITDKKKYLFRLIHFPLTVNIRFHRSLLLSIKIFSDGSMRVARLEIKNKATFGKYTYTDAISRIKCTNLLKKNPLNWLFKHEIYTQKATHSAQSKFNKAPGKEKKIHISLYIRHFMPERELWCTGTHNKKK